MHKILAFTVFFLFAFSSAAIAAPKIATCDLQKVADQSEALQEAFVALERALAPEKEKLEKERAILEEQAAVLQNPSATEKEREIFMTRQAKYMADTTDLINNVKESEIRVRMEMDNIILEAAEGYAKKEKFDLILDTQSVLFKNDSAIKTTDITEPMVSEVNRIWKKRDN